MIYQASSGEWGAPEKSALEHYVRRLRDYVYGPQSENNWTHCRENWMKEDSIRFLERFVPVPFIIQTAAEAKVLQE